MGLDRASSRAARWRTQAGGEATQAIPEIETSEDAEVVNYVLKSDTTTLSATFEYEIDPAVPGWIQLTLSTISRWRM
ncbi:MAG: hypothetical protein M3170_03360 [Candidatus Dormibacteraeota bacterium]|nr:hypothetical protein [Candidatus Dormibacteraeota bacterium]